LEIGLDFKEKPNDIEYQKKHAIIVDDHSKCFLLTYEKAVGKSLN